MKSYIKIILLLLLPLCLIGAYSIWGGDWGLKKANFSILKHTAEEWISKIKAEQQPLVAPSATEQNATATNDTTLQDTIQSDSATVHPPIVTEPDTSAQRILFIGDSMLEGLTRRLSDYAMENKHTLTSVIWYSSTSQHWAESDTLEYFIRKTEPTFIAICLCSNELFVRDLDERDKWLSQIVQKMGDIPFVWISPPNWTEDTGINDLIIKNVGAQRYFDSRHLTLQRGRDKIHPTFKAAERWMDSVAVWMSGTTTRHPIKMDQPTIKRKRRFSQYILAPN